MIWNLLKRCVRKKAEDIGFVKPKVEYTYEGISRFICSAKLPSMAKEFWFSELKPDQSPEYYEALYHEIEKTILW